VSFRSEPRQSPLPVNDSSPVDRHADSRFTNLAADETFVPVSKESPFVARFAVLVVLAVELLQAAAVIAVEVDHADPFFGHLKYEVDSEIARLAGQQPPDESDPQVVLLGE